MRLFRLLLLSLWAVACGAQADMPDYQVFPAKGTQLLLWMSSERGRSEPEVKAAQELAAQGVEVWSLDAVNAYFLPPLPHSMDAVPRQDIANWLHAALATGKQVGVFAVARAAVPVLTAASQLEPDQRARISVLLMQPNLYTVAEPLAAPDYLDVGDLSGLRIRVLQPRRSAAMPWLPGLLHHLDMHGATASHEILENLREGYWAREAPTDFEVAEGRHLGGLLLHELEAMGQK